MGSDQALTEHIAMGDQASFEAFVHRYHSPILSYLERLLNDRDKAEDIVQETFIKFLHQLESQRIPDNVRAWLYRVATNQCRDYWRSASYRKERNVFDHIPEQKDRQAKPSDIYERTETRNEMFQLLNELSNTQREIVIMRFYNDLKLQEIADVMECPLGTVKTRLFHALRLLKSRIEEGGRVDYA